MRGIFAQEKYFFFLTPALVWQIVFFFLPLLFVIQLAFCHQFFYGLTFEYVSQVLHWTHLVVILRSLTLASITAIACLLFGYPMACFLALYVSKRYKSIFLFLITLPFLTNVLVQIYAWYFILEKDGVLNKFLSLFSSNLGSWINGVLAMYVVVFHIYLPFMVMPLYAILEKVDIRLIESSLDLGASYAQTFFRVVLPLSKQGIKTGFFLVYVMTFGEYVVPSLIGGQKHFFVGTLISEYFFIGRDWHVGAAFTCMSSLIFLGSIILFNYLWQRVIVSLQRI